MSTLFKGVRGMTQEQYEELAFTGEVIIDGEKITYDEDYIYFTPDEITLAVNEHTEKIAKNTSDIVSIQTDVVSLKTRLNDAEETLVNVNDSMSNLSKTAVTTNTQQTITGPKTFTEHIYLANSDGTVDRISHLNNNFIIHSGATNSAVLNIDEGLSKIYAFNNELAFKSDIAEAAGTTVYVDGTAVASLNFSADPQTQINLIAEGLETQLNAKVSKSGDTMTGELIASAGVAFGNNKIKAENSGNTFEIVHLENTVEKNIFNYTHGGIFTLNNSETPLIIQGSDDRPSYVSGSGTMSDLALESDIDKAIAGLGTVFDLKGTKETLHELPSTGNTIGDVWYVSSEQVGYIWLNDGTGERWERFGAPIELSGYATTEETANLQEQITANDSDITRIDGEIETLKQYDIDFTNVLVAMEGVTTNLQEQITSNDTDIENINNAVNAIPDWAKQATKPEYDYSEIKNTPESADINFDAINFAEEERQKSKNLLRPRNIYDYIRFNTLNKLYGVIEPYLYTYTDNSTGTHGVYFQSTEIENQYLIKAYNNIHYAVFKNLKPNTKYTFSFTVDKLSTMIFMGISLQASYVGTRRHITFTTDSNGEYSIRDGFRSSYADGTGYIYASDIQLEEGDVSTDYVQYSGLILHQSDIEPIFDGKLLKAAAGFAITDFEINNNEILCYDISLISTVSADLGVLVNTDSTSYHTFGLAHATTDAHYNGTSWYSGYAIPGRFMAHGEIAVVDGDATILCKGVATSDTNGAYRSFGGSCNLAGDTITRLQFTFGGNFLPVDTYIRVYKKYKR